MRSSEVSMSHRARWLLQTHNPDRWMAEIKYLDGTQKTVKVGPAGLSSFKCFSWERFFAALHPKGGDVGRRSRYR